APRLVEALLAAADGRVILLARGQIPAGSQRGQVEARGVRLGASARGHAAALGEAVAIRIEASQPGQRLQYARIDIRKERGIAGPPVGARDLEDETAGHVGRVRHESREAAVGVSLVQKAGPAGDLAAGKLEMGDSGQFAAVERWEDGAEERLPGSPPVDQRERPGAPAAVDAGE